MDAHKKQKTAIRQLTDCLIETIKETENDPKLSGLRAALKVIVKKGKELEPINKQQIIDAYGDSVGKSGKQYFDETFEN